MVTVSRLSTFLSIAGHLALAQIQAGQALVVPTSGQWDGVDGPWSTFNLGVGQPLQLFHCLPAFSLPLVVLPIESPECNSTTGARCARHTIFKPDNSTTYRSLGKFPIEVADFVALVPDDIPRRAVWGIDNVYFGNDAVRNLGSAEQYVIGFEAYQFNVGLFGLGLGTTRMNNVEGKKRNLLNALFATGVVPSNTVSYTAGSIGTNSSGSLVLGGYDTARFNSNTTISVQMPSKDNNSLLVDLESVSIPGSGLSDLEWSAPSGSANRTFRIDTFFSQIFLPQAACDMFEAAFGLQWNHTLNLYTVNETTHEKLIREKPSVSFSIGASPTSQHQKYALPYSAFDLRLAPPMVETPTYYFPLKRAANASHYILGRAFLQGTYITVDYGRANFSLSQAYPAGGSGYVVPISNGTSETTGLDSGDADLSPGAYAGIGVGAFLAATFAIGIALSWRKGWCIFRKKSRKHDDVESRRDSESHHKFEKSELDGKGKPVVEIMEKERSEFAAEAEYEAMGRERGTVELETVERKVEAAEGMHAVYEMHGDSIGADGLRKEGEMG